MDVKLHEMQSSPLGKENQGNTIDITLQTAFVCNRKSVLTRKSVLGSNCIQCCKSSKRINMFYLLKDIFGAYLWVSCVWLIECLFPQLTDLWLPVAELCSTSGLIVIQ